jgi:transcriptional regulator with XRE-family HTH domain
MRASASATKVAGERIREIRGAHKWSLETLAAKVGLTRKGLSKIELGRTSPAVDRYERIAKALGVSLTALFVGPPRRARASVQEKRSPKSTQ